MGITWADLSVASHARLWEHFNGLKAAINAALDNVPAGRAIKTDWFQSASGGVAVVLAQDYVQGGMTWDAANGGGLKVPTAGVYQIAASVYFSGGAGRGGMDIRRWRAGVGTTVLSGNTAKPSGDDFTAVASSAVKLNAGDIITLKATAPSTAYGTSGAETWLSVVKVA